MIDLARRSGQVLSLNAYAVREGDEFNYQLGLHPDIHHVPSCEADRVKKPITFVYAVATLRGGGYQFEVMSRAEVEAVKAKAKSKNIWNNYFEEMAKKTVIRRLFKYLPVSIEALQITNVDAKREAGEEVKPEDVIDINAVSVDDFKDIEDAEVVGTSQDAQEAHCMRSIVNLSSGLLSSDVNAVELKQDERLKKLDPIAIHSLSIIPGKPKYLLMRGADSCALAHNIILSKEQSLKLIRSLAEALSDWDKE